MRTLLAVACSIVCGAATAVAGGQMPMRTVWDGVYTTGQAERGAFIYARYCSRCHGADLSGPAAMGGRLPGQSPAPALVGSEFNYRWHELSVGDLAQRVRSMPPANPGALSREDGIDVLAFILARGGFPSGDEDLPVGSPALSTITFLATKP